MYKTVRTGIIVLIMMVIVTAFVSADASISYMEGEVSVRRNGENLTAEIGMDLFQGDIVSTGSEGLAIVDMDGRGTLKLLEQTVITLDSLESRASVSLSRGGLFSRIKRLANRGYQVRTAGVVAAVRGTEFFVAYGKTIEEEPDLWLCVNEGSVDVALTDGGDSVLVEEGLGINILGTRKITDPRFYAWTENLNWNSDPSAGSVRDETNLDSLYADLRDFDYD